MDSSRMNRGCCGANNMQNRRAASNNMELKMEPRNFPRKMQHVDHMIPAMAYVPMQRFPPGCFGQWNCHRSKLVGKIENNQPDDYDHSSDR